MKEDTGMQDFWFKTIVNGTYMLKGYEGDDADIVIPSSYFGETVTVIGDDVFKNRKEIRSVTIPEGVMELGGFVFDGCENLRDVVLPDTLISIWQYAFVRSGIEEIIIPRNVKTIVPFTFQECRNLRSVTLMNPAAHISAYAFRDCPELRTLRYAKELTYSEQAFPCGMPELIRKDMDTAVSQTGNREAIIEL